MKVTKKVIAGLLTASLLLAECSMISQQSQCQRQTHQQQQNH